MPDNWKSINETLVRTAKNTDILDTLQAKAAAKGEADPLPALITKSIGRIHSAIMAANDLDTDATKIPATLEWLALNLIIRAIKDYNEMELSPTELQQQRSDDSYLADILRTRQKFLPADNPAGTGNVGPSVNVQAVGVPRRQTGRGRQSAL
jgi:hypothetical protein